MLFIFNLHAQMEGGGKLVKPKEANSSSTGTEN